MPTFQIQLRSPARYVVKGTIDERADFRSIDTKAPKTYLNFAGVVGINSLGAANFLNFAMGASQTKLVYEQCPIILVTAFIMLPALLGTEENTASILSLQVLYACDTCNSIDMPYVQASAIRSTGHHLTFPENLCPGCKSPMRIEGMTEEYMCLFEAGAMRAA